LHFEKDKEGKKKRTCIKNIHKEVKEATHKDQEKNE